MQTYAKPCGNVDNTKQKPNPKQYFEHDFLVDIFLCLGWHSILYQQTLLSLQAFTIINTQGIKTQLDH